MPFLNSWQTIRSTTRISATFTGTSIKELGIVECGHEGIEYVLGALKTLIASEREVLKQASQIGDEVTVAIMSDWLKEQEKTSWMLVAFEKANCQK